MAAPADVDGPNLRNDGAALSRSVMRPVPLKTVGVELGAWPAMHASDREQIS